MRTNNAKRKTQAGLTLIELLMFIVIVAIAAVGMLQVYRVTVKQSADPQLRKQALALAEGLLEEVQLSRFTYCEPILDPLADDPVARPNPAACSVAEAVGNEDARSRPYDNINDYVNGFGSETQAFNVLGDLLDAAGDTINLQGYTATLAIYPESLNGISSGNTPATMEVLRISVTVKYNDSRESLTLDTYRTRYAPHAIP